MSDAVLCVAVGDAVLGLPLAALCEVLRPLPLTRVPHAPPFLVGLANLRGQVLPVASAARLLGQVETGTNAQAGARIVVVMRARQRVGLLVDAVLPGRPAGMRRFALDACWPDDVSPRTRIAAAAAPTGTAAAPGGDAAAQTAAEAGKDTRIALLAFRVGGQEFALPLSALETVCARGTVSQPVAGADPVLHGVLERRDALVPVLRARALLGLDGSDDDGRLLLVRTAGRLAGLAVDAVGGIVRAAPDAFEPLPTLLRSRGDGMRVDAICRLDRGRRLIQVLDPDRLLPAGKSRLPALPPVQEPVLAPEAASMPADAVERVLLVRLGADRFGLPLDSVRAVLRHPGRLDLLPNAPALVAGGIALGGRVLPVIDRKTRRDGAPVPPEQRRIVVLQSNEAQLGLAVDAASELAGFAPGTLRPASAFDPEAPSGRAGPPGADGNAPVLMLDPAFLLRGMERRRPATAVGGARA